MINGTPVRKEIWRRWAYRIGFSLALAGWAALIFYLTELPGDQVSRVGPYDSAAVVRLGGLRSILAHFFLFGILASFIQATIWSWTRFTNHSLSLAGAAIIIAVLYGFLDEYHQSFVVGRQMSASDLLINFLGAVVAATALRQVVKTAYESPAWHFRLAGFKA